MRGSRVTREARCARRNRQSAISNRQSAIGNQQPARTRRTSGRGWGESRGWHRGPPPGPLPWEFEGEQTRGEARPASLLPPPFLLGRREAEPSGGGNSARTPNASPHTPRPGCANGGGASAASGGGNSARSGTAPARLGCEWCETSPTAWGRCRAAGEAEGDVEPSPGAHHAFLAPLSTHAPPPTPPWRAGPPPTREQRCKGCLRTPVKDDPGPHTPVGEVPARGGERQRGRAHVSVWR